MLFHRPFGTKKVKAAMFIWLDHEKS